MTKKKIYQKTYPLLERSNRLVARIENYKRGIKENTLLDPEKEYLEITKESKALKQAINKSEFRNSVMHKGNRR